MLEPVSKNPVRNFSRGFFYPFSSVRFLLAHPGLLRYVAIPFVINLLVFIGAVYLGIDFFEGTVVDLIPQGEAWYWSLLFYFLWTAAVAVTAVLVFFTFALVGNLIASPFNDLLSERTEKLLMGDKKDEPFSLSGFLRDGRRILAVEVKKISVFFIVMLLILPLNFIPGIGSLIYGVLATILTLFFLVVEYLGYVFSRKGLSFKEQRQYIFSRRLLMFGFGAGVLAVLSIPFFQFFCIPVAVVGATRLWCDAGAKEKS